MDSNSFKRQFLSFHPKLYRIAFALVENTEDAEDILQDTYCKLWDRRKELKYIKNPEAYCVTLVKNSCFDLLRSLKHNIAREDINENVLQQTESSPEKKMIEQDNFEIIKGIIDELPENQRQIIRLKGMKDCSMDEIEEITGLTAINIRVLLSRARKTIRNKMDKQLSYER
jgi:RNA polymerase sigma factor, sigma-70 family